MIKKPQFVAFGVVLFGVFLFGIGVYLLAKESLAPTPTAANPVISTPLPTAPGPVANKAKVKPSISQEEPTPVPVPTAMPVKRVPSSVQWVKRDSYLGAQTWKVNLSSDKWFDTGIPYITNDTLNINKYGSQETDPHTLIKVNGNVFANKEGRQIFYFDRDGFKPSIRDTVKLRLEEGAQPTELEITLNHIYNVCPDYENHKEIHQASIAWSDTMVSRTKR